MIRLWLPPALAGRLHAQLARRVGAEEIALQDAVADHIAVARRHAVAVEGGAAQAAFGICGRSAILKSGMTFLPR